MSDAVVIGAGPNGLAAAIRLAEAGRQVLVLEAADAPGGAVRTEELTLPGFRHDTFSSVYPASAASPVFGRMPLDKHGLEWVHPEAAYAHPLPDGEAKFLYGDLQRTAQVLGGRDGENWVKFTKPFLDNFDAVRATMLSGFPPVGGPLKLLTGAGPLRLVDLTRMLLGSAVGLGNRLFEDSGNRAWLYGAAMHGDAPPDARRLGDRRLLPQPARPRRRLAEPPRRRRAADRRARVLLQEPRRRAAHRRARPARAERERPGHRRRERRRALPGHDRDRRRDAERTDAHDPLPELVHGRAEEVRARCRDGQGGLGARRPDPLGQPDVTSAGTVHVSGSESDFLRSVKQSHDGLADQPFLLLGQQSVADPTRAPEGKHTAWAYTHGPQQGVDWKAATPDVAERMEAQVERFAPGFRDRILARHVLGPANSRPATRTSWAATSAAAATGCARSSSARCRSSTPYSTPLKGLFIGSAATFPGGAVHGVPGDAAARAALR